MVKRTEPPKGKNKRARSTFVPWFSIFTFRDNKRALFKALNEKGRHTLGSLYPPFWKHLTEIMNNRVSTESRWSGGWCSVEPTALSQFSRKVSIQGASPLFGPDTTRFWASAPGPPALCGHQQCVVCWNSLPCSNCHHLEVSGLTTSSQNPGLPTSPMPWDLPLLPTTFYCHFSSDGFAGHLPSENLGNSSGVPHQKKKKIFMSLSQKSWLYFFYSLCVVVYYLTLALEGRFHVRRELALDTSHPWCLKLCSQSYSHKPHTDESEGSEGGSFYWNVL